MSQQNETGHARNVANLKKIIEQVTVYSEYNPPIDNLKKESLNTLYNNALIILSEVEEKRTANKNAIHTRQETFGNLKSTSTRIINQLEILGLTTGVLEQAKSLNRLIHGSKKKKNDSNSETVETNKTVSTSRQSYTQLAENFSKLLQLLETIPSYNPNTEALKLKTLKTYYTSLVTTTEAVDKTEAELNTKVIDRNKILYTTNTGLYTIAQNVKRYVKSVYGATSPEYSKVSKIKFTTK